MNYRYVANQLGLLMLVLGLLIAMVAALGAGLALGGHEGEWESAGALGIGAGLCVFLGAGAWLATRRCSRRLDRREALLLVALSWILGAVLAGAPFHAWARLSGAEEHAFGSLINCYFEAMSGLTTTGATILSGIEHLPASLLLWRAMTQWLGGLGIVVLFVAVLPSLGVGGKRLFHAESSTPQGGGVHPHIRETARMLWYIYVGLTVAAYVALRGAGLGPLDAITHAFTSLATGGYSTMDASAGGFRSPAVHVIMIVFMILGGVNFALYHHAARGRLRQIVRDPELRLYLGMLAGATALAALFTWYMPITITTGQTLEHRAGPAILHSLFSVVSLQTTTGYASADFDRWPMVAKGVLIIVMLVGGCAGSTSGGIKVIRIWIVLKIMLAQIERVFRPSVVRPLRVGGSTVDTEQKLAVVSYVLGIVVLFVLGTGALMVLEQHNGADFETLGSACIATLCTIGPGLGRAGATENYEFFTAGSKAVLCVLMLLGRLEVFAVIVLFSPKFWRGQ